MRGRHAKVRTQFVEAHRATGGAAAAAAQACHARRRSLLLRATVSLVQTRKPALAFIFVTLVLDILGIGLIIPNLPLLVKQFTGNNTEAASHAVGWLASLYSLMQFGC